MVFAISEQTRREIASMGFVAQGKVRLVQMVLAKLFLDALGETDIGEHDFGLSAKTKVILNVNTELSKRKNLFFALETISFVTKHESDCILVIVGPKGEQRSVMEEAASRRIAANVKYFSEPLLSGPCKTIQEEQFVTYEFSKGRIWISIA